MLITLMLFFGSVNGVTPTASCENDFWYEARDPVELMSWNVMEVCQTCDKVAVGGSKNGHFYLLVKRITGTIDEVIVW